MNFKRIVFSEVSSRVKVLFFREGLSFSKVFNTFNILSTQIEFKLVFPSMHDPLLHIEIVSVLPTPNIWWLDSPSPSLAKRCLASYKRKQEEKISEKKPMK